MQKIYILLHLKSQNATHAALAAMLIKEMNRHGKKRPGAR